MVLIVISTHERFEYLKNMFKLKFSSFDGRNNNEIGY